MMRCCYWTRYLCLKRYRLRRNYLLIVVVLCLILLYLQWTNKHTTTTQGQTWFLPKPHTDNPLKYLVHTDVCRIPDINPFDPSIKDFIRPIPLVKCPTGLSLVYQEGLMLKLNKNAELYSDQFSHCLYQGIQRTDDNNVNMKTSVKFTSDIKISEPFVRVYCYNKKNFLNIFENFFAFIIPDKLQSPAEEQTQNAKSSNNAEVLNVVMVGMDSLSRLNHIRTMPKTRKYLLEILSAVELQGYTKLGDNTFPNIVPLTTGKHVHELPWDNSMRHKPFDEYNFIWKSFRSKKYITQYSEDDPSVGEFSLSKGGFRDPPTDHYMRPFAVAAEYYYNNYYFDLICRTLHINHRSVWSADHHCLGNRYETSIYLNYISDFMKTYRNQPHFSFSFITRLTHGNLPIAASADELYYSWFQKVNNDHLLNNTVLIYFSDHGVRYDEFRKTYVGKMEERLPMMYLVFPHWFYQKYPKMYSNLKMNSNRLTSPFDIYETLTHILSFDGTIQGNINPKQRGVSLLEEIPQTRTCDDAGISAHWCVCMAQEEINPDDKFVVSGANFLVSELNRQLWVNGNKNCATLKLNKIMSAYINKYNDKLVHYRRLEDDHVARPRAVMAEKTKTVQIYQITVSLQPGSGELEATVKYNEMTETYSMGGDVSRINKYGHDGDCIDDYRLRKFCFCE